MSHRIRATLPLLAIAAAALCLACRMLQATEGPPARPAPPPPPPQALPRIIDRTLITAWDLLPADREEKPGYGLYTYLLCPPSADPNAPARCRAAIAALRIQPHTAEQERYSPRSRINVTYIPVEAGVPLEASDTELLAAYDRARARAILAALPDAGGRGPFLVSCLDPFGSTFQIRSPCAFQDLTLPPPSFVGAWVEFFRVSVTQERDWTRDRLGSFLLQLRTILAIFGNGYAEVQAAFDAAGFGSVSEALDALIRLIEPVLPRSGSRSEAPRDVRSAGL